MNGTSFTRLGRSGITILVFLLFTFGTITSAYAQSVGCACKGTVQISVDENCQATVTADMLLAGTNDCTGGTVVLMPTPTGQPIAGSPVIGSQWVGKTLYGKVTNGTNTCWSVINVEDKMAPYWADEEPADIVTICPMLSTYVPVALDNCDIPFVYIVSETVTVNNCNQPSIFAGPDTLKLIERRYLARDKSGNISKEECIVRIWVTALDSENLIAVPNVTLQCDAPYARLENGHPSPVDIVQGSTTFFGSGVPRLYPWMPVTTGAGSTSINPSNGNLRLVGGTSPSTPPGFGAQLCVRIPQSGTISFSWQANMDGTTPPPGNYANDHAGYSVNGVFTNLTVGGAGSGSTPQSGTANVPVNQGDIFCFAVQTNNAQRWTVMNVSNITGPIPAAVPLNPDVITACNIFVSYTDTKFPTIKCVTKILRKWTVLEWSCDSRITEFFQIIEIVDSKGPEITGLNDVYASTGGHACEALIRLPKPGLKDNCSSNLTYDVTYPGGFFKGLKLSDPDRFVRIPFGVSEITYTAFDECHNQSTATITVYVDDNTPPVAICKEWTTVGLTTDGKAWVPATSFDNGSYDECDLAKLVVRRMTAPDCIKPCKTPEIPGFTLLDIINGRYYYISNHAVRPSIALKTAKALENYVVTYNNDTERNAIRNQVTAWYGNIPFLIGYTDLKLKGTYVWEAPSTYAPSLSGGYQYVIHTGSGSLSSVDDSAEYRYVMELEDPCGFAAYTEFCCNDIGADQMVRMRAIDKSGNWNECMVRAVIQDKLPPSIVCPPHMTVTCLDYFDVAQLRHHFGWPTAFDNCEQPTITTDSVINLNSCRIGHITRTFTVTDKGGRRATCTQHIVVNNHQNRFEMTSDRWPADITITDGCADPSSPAFDPSRTGRPNLSADNICSLVGATYEDQVFYFNNSEGDACFKILRHWTVLDWCQATTYEGGTTYRTWTHTQVIKVHDKDKPVITSSCAPKSECTFDPTCTDGYIELIATAEDKECTTILRWSYRIDAFNDGSFESGLSKSGLGNTVNASGRYPIGTHKIVWQFEDRCGNLTKCEQLFSILDCKDPTPVCVPLSTALMADPDGNGPMLPMVEIWAIDFDRKSYKSCNANEVLRFTFDQVPMQVANKTVFGQVININTKHYFDRTGGLLRWQSTPYPAGSPERAIVDRYNRGEANSQQGGRIQLWDPATRSSATVWSSNDLGPQNSGRDVNINMTVWDEGFRKDFCMTTLKLICNNCGGGEPGQGRIAGNVSTEKGANVSEVHVSVDANLIEFPKAMMTGTNGNYEFMLESTKDYLVKAVKDTDHLNGVSTLDLVLIQRHILGLHNLGSPYKLIAADANNDGKITAADLTELRKLILGNVMELPENSSWRFPIKHQIMDPANPFPFAEIYDIHNLESDMLDQSFVAVKIGDVNESVQLNAQNNTLESRSASRMEMIAPNVKFNAGESFEIPVTMANNADISGLQFTIAFNADMFEVNNVAGHLPGIKESNFGFTRLAEGLIAVSWNKDAAVQLSNGDQIITLNLKAKSKGELNDNMAINSAMIQAEAYDANAQVMNIEFRTGAKTSLAGFNLYQNTPNPFKAATTIGFDLPESMQATLSVYDVTGKLLRTYTQHFAKGYNSIEVNRNEVGNAGVLYYTLEAGEFKATRKMVIIE
ncbi:MAG: T9SS type A sorting domain-containing protein [Saprospiraceae bacterium]|nr:T9SS type A sorting domain-containing protein [Saprospiraceae bacterium]